MTDRRFLTADDQEAYDALTQAVGRALDSWSQIEFYMAETFQTMSGIPDAKTAHAVVASIVSLDARLDVCSTLIRMSDQPSLIKKYWNGLRTRTAKQSKKRNGIAHFTIIKAKTTDDEEFWALAPFFSLGQIANAEIGSGELKTHSVKTISEMRESFEALTLEYRWFNFEIHPQKDQRGVNIFPEPHSYQRLRDETDEGER